MSRFYIVEAITRNNIKESRPFSLYRDAKNQADIWETKYKTVQIRRFKETVARCHI